MNGNEHRAGSVADQKNKIRERYKGINPDELDVIPALPQEDIFAIENEQRVAVYARVSTDDPRQTSSYELQKNHYHDVISKSPNWKLVRIYADEGISGTSLQHRDQFKQMINDCKNGEIDLIVTKSVSRFARNVVDCIGYVRELLSLPHPVGVFFETERLNTFDPKSEMVLSFMATLAQEESHTKSEIMNASIEMRFRRGIFLTPILLGYDHDEDGNLVINEDEAKIVKLIFMMYLNGCTCQEIADTLTGLGSRPKKETPYGPLVQSFKYCRMKGTVEMFLPTKHILLIILTTNQRKICRTALSIEKETIMKQLYHEMILLLYNGLSVMQNTETKVCCQNLRLFLMVFSKDLYPSIQDGLDLRILTT